MHADLVIRNGNIVTLDDARPRAQAMAVKGERIVALGDEREVLASAGPTTELIDARGLTVLPGFNDNHLHALAMGYFFQHPNLFGLDAEHIVAVLAQHYPRPRPGQRILTPLLFSWASSAPSLTAPTRLCEHRPMATLVRARVSPAALSATLLAACGSSASPARDGGAAADVADAAPDQLTVTLRFPDASDSPSSYVTVGDAGYLRVGDALLPDPEAWNPSGHLVGVDGGLGAATACTQSSDCTLVPVTCACYVFEQSEVRGLNVAYADHWAGPWCTGRCDVALEPRLVPSCVAGTCTVVDIRQNDFTACTTAADCRVRVRECCECGGDSDVFRLIALAKQGVADYEALVCDNPRKACDACVPDYPPTAGFGPVAEIVCYQGRCDLNAMIVDPLF